MKDQVKPRVFASKCLGFAATRWNGATITDEFVEKLKPFVTYVTTCPEVEIGLGVPRDPIRIVLKGGKYSLMQLGTEKDVTKEMTKFARDFIDGLGEVDGFILKDRSPSCGVKEVKVYPGLEPGGVIQKTDGFFAKEVLERYPQLPVETEGRLTNYSIREHFMTRIFTNARFRKIKESLKMKDLVQFHTENKLLLMAYSQKELGALGSIVANHEKKKAETVLKAYETHLAQALDKPPKYTSSINVMMHGLGYFSRELTSREKQFFLNTLEEYQREQVPLSVPVNILKSFIVRFQESYLEQQTFFDPYPEELVAITDSGKGRNLS